MRNSDRPSIPWWLVPNLVALDAPLVAVIWQRFLASRAGLAVPWAASAALAATVWSVYLIDRWLDARRGKIDADRHRIAARYPLAFPLAAFVASVLAMAFAVQLPAPYIQLGLGIGAGIALYLALVHAVAGGLSTRWGAKELLVAIGFAAGVSIPLLASDVPAARWWPSVVAFGGLCWLNCHLIDCWESNVPGECRWLAIVVGTLLAASAAWLPGDLGWAVTGSALGLLAVHFTLARRPRVARVLADAVLLIPIVGLVP